MAWPAERVLAYGRFGILATVLLLPALEAPLPLVGALLPGQTAVAMGGLLAWHGRVPVVAALVTAVVGAVLGNVAGYAVGRRFSARLLARVPADGRRRRSTDRALGLIRTARWQRRVRRPLHRRPADPRAHPVRSHPYAAAPLPRVVGRQQRRRGARLRPDRVRHGAGRARVTHLLRKLLPQQEPADAAPYPATRPPQRWPRRGRFPTTSVPPCRAGGPTPNEWDR